MRVLLDTHIIDPFDKILLCQAKQEKMQFLTHDKLLLAYDMPNIVYV